MENAQIQQVEAQVRELATAVLARADELDVKIGCAESCTGGMIAAALTSVPGSSQSFVGGVVSYWVSVKESLLEVDPDVVEKYGVVSAQTAHAMACGARKALACDYAVSTTGIAGPTGAEPGKPVGTVWYGLCAPGFERTFTTCKGSSRDEVRLFAVHAALSALKDALDAHSDTSLKASRSFS